MEKNTVAIGGMSCAACAKRVEKSVGKIKGVLSVSVNFASEKATVVYDPQRTSLSDIHAAVERRRWPLVKQTLH